MVKSQKVSDNLLNSKSESVAFGHFQAAGYRGGGGGGGDGGAPKHVWTDGRTDGPGGPGGLGVPSENEFWAMCLAGGSKRTVDSEK